MVGGGDEMQMPLKKLQPGIKVGNEIISLNMPTPCERHCVNIAREIAMRISKILEMRVIASNRHRFLRNLTCQ
jgi:hypothetical protein